MLSKLVCGAETKMNQSENNFSSKKVSIYSKFIVSLKVTSDSQNIEHLSLHDVTA